MKSWMLELLKVLLTVISSPLREAVVAAVKEWEKKAAVTAAPWDDVFVGVIKWLLQIP